GGLAASPPFAAAREALQQHLVNHRALRAARRNSLCDSISDVSAVVRDGIGVSHAVVLDDTPNAGAESIDLDNGHAGGQSLAEVSNWVAAAKGSLLPRSSRPPRPIGQSFRTLLQPDGGAAGGITTAAEERMMVKAAVGSGNPAIQDERTANIPGQQQEHQKQSASSSSPPPPLLPFASWHLQVHQQQQQQEQQPYRQHFRPPASVLPLPPRLIPSRERAAQQDIPVRSIGPEADPTLLWSRRQQIERVGSSWRPFSSPLLRVPWPATSLIGAVLQHLAARKPPPLRAGPQQQLDS
ncbi:hypothetical protein Vafri_959, partial [Volvox africanus]